VRKRAALTAGGDASRTLGRRDVILVAGGTTAAVLVAPVTGLLPSSPAAAATRMRTVYRLSPLGQPACHACRAHGANRYYTKAKAANRDRAHRGCNCAIVAQQVPEALWEQYFRPDGVPRRVFDLRWGAPQRTEAKG
jgi:hypothetical protein